MPNIFAKLAAYRQRKEETSSPPNTDENIAPKIKKSRRWQVMDRTFEWKMAWALLVFMASMLLAPETVGGQEQKENEVRVPVIMYHLVTENSRYVGKYGIRPSELKSDLEYLRDNGYNTIVIQDLINFVEEGKPLPNKPIVLTFDDGNSSDHQYLLPLLKEFDMKAVSSIIGVTTDKITRQHAENPDGRYPNMTWGQVVELHESGAIEIQSHGFDLHGKAGAGKRRGESVDAYHQRLMTDLRKLDDRCNEHLGYRPNTFCYPYGIISKDSQAVLEELGYKASLSCEERINIIRQGEKGDLFKLNRVNRASGRSVENILNMLQKKEKS
ncbi:MAG: polysaccharide deacetylase family protein [Defluviitaleaceae bacterium]|nr:polysaccharide deacetylase family protein [Defluviitaleaceae bacterium]